MTKRSELWQKRDDRLAEAVKKAAVKLLAHQNIRPARMYIPLENGLWVTIGKIAEE